MNALFILLLLTFTDARKKKGSPISPSSVDIYPERFDHPVDFGHVYRSGHIPEGVEDRDPRDIPTHLEYTRRKPEPPKPGATFASPRDELDFYMKYGNPDIPNLETKNGRERMWIDFPELLLRNIAHPVQAHSGKVALPDKLRAPVLGEEEEPKIETGKSQYLSKQSFGLVGEEVNVLNWTTCDQFKVGAKFHPVDVLGIKWLPFYVWTTGLYPTAYFHEFRRPTQKLVGEYRNQYGRYLDRRIDWEQPKLVLNNMKEQLLIAGDKKGLFYSVMHVHIPEHVRDKDIVLPLIPIRLKRKNQYLLMMRCSYTERYISAMAIAGEGPTEDTEKIKIAQTFNIRGDGLPVKRDPEREDALRTFQQNVKMRSPIYNDTLHLHPDFGLFPPEAV